MWTLTLLSTVTIDHLSNHSMLQWFHKTCLDRFEYNIEALMYIFVNIVLLSSSVPVI